MKIRIQQLFTQSSKGRVLPPNALATPNSPRSCHRPPSSGPCRIQQASKRPRVTSPSSPASSKQAARRCGWLLAEESFRKWYLDEAIQAVKKSRKNIIPYLVGGNAKKRKTQHILENDQNSSSGTILYYVILCFEVNIIHFWGWNSPPTRYETDVLEDCSGSFRKAEPSFGRRSREAALNFRVCRPKTSVKIKWPDMVANRGRLNSKWSHSTKQNESSRDQLCSEPIFNMVSPAWAFSPQGMRHQACHPHSQLKWRHHRPAVFGRGSCQRASHGFFFQAAATLSTDPQGRRSLPFRRWGAIHSQAEGGIQAWKAWKWSVWRNP